MPSGRPVVRTAQGVTEQPGGVFVGRQHELDELDTGLAHAVAGRGGMFLLAGEPGIGKTRLADEFSVRAQANGALVLWGRCWEGGGAPAYWPWVQIVRSYVRHRDPQSLRDELGASTAHVAQIAPELRDLIPDLPPPPSLESEQARFALLDALGEFLLGAAGREPLVLVLDDLHVADRASLLALQFLARELRDSRILVLGSYREIEAQRDPELAALLGELARFGRSMPLRGLSEADVASLIARAGHGSPHPTVVKAIHEATDGSPFFVDELVRLLQAERRLQGPLSPGAWLGIPTGVREAIARRLAMLSGEANRALSIAAVIGRDFDARVVERIAGLAEGRVLSALEEAVAAQLVVESLRALRRYSFRHVLVREVIYDALPVEHRAQLHHQVGEALEELHGTDAEAHVAELAHHFFEAAAAGGAAKAAELSARAGDRAAEMLAHEEARGHYRRALQSIDLAGGSDRRRCELLIRVAEAEWRAGDSGPARRTFQAAAAIARGLGAPELLARAAIGYARGLGAFLTTLRADTTIVSLLEEALAALSERDSVLRARLLARLAAELYYTDQVERRVELSRAAIAMARRLEDPGALLVALYGHYWAACGPETLEERLANATEMVRLANELGEDEMAFLAHHVRLWCLLEDCDAIEPVDGEIETMDRLAAELRQPFYRWRVACLHTMRAILEARFEDAERLAAEALEIGRGVDDELATIYHDFAQLFALRFGQGRLAEVEDEVLSYTRRYPGPQPWRLPLLYSELGREPEARAELERQAAHGFELPADGLWIAHVATLAHACVLVGDAGRAERLYELLLPYADRNVSTVGDQIYGPVATPLGMLAGLMERWEEAERHFEAGHERCRALRAPTFTALNLCEQARMLLARAGPGDREAAVDLLDEAEATCRRHGIGAILERVLEHVARAERRPREAECLFRRDGDYWTIVFEGDVARVRDSKGLRYLAQLLANPGFEVHVLDLVAAAGGRSGGDPGAARAARTAAAGMHVSRLEGAGQALDAEAKAAYRRRLEELSEELEQARAFNDPERAAGLELEMDALQRELRAAVGLGGRDRQQASPSERARVNVTRAIRGSIERIGEGLPALAEHLCDAVRTGTSCAYLPPPGARPDWRL
jgi:hypothetical protein